MTQHTNPQKVQVAQPIHFDTPPHIHRLQAAVCANDAKLLATKGAPPFFLRDHIPGEWWPFAVSNSNLTVVAPAANGGSATVPFSNLDTHYRRIPADDDITAIIADTLALAGVRAAAWWDVEYGAVKGEDKHALDEAQLMWRQAARLSPRVFQEYLYDECLRYMRLFRVPGTTEVR